MSAIEARIGWGVFCFLACLLYAGLDSLLFVRSASSLARKKSMLSFAFLGLACSGAFFAVGTIWSYSSLLISLIRAGAGLYPATLFFLVCQGFSLGGLVKFHKGDPISTPVLLLFTFASPIFIAILAVAMLYIKELMFNF